MKSLTIIIPLYNGEQYIRRCLDSICSQSYGLLKILIVDDGSTDDSLKTVRKYKEEYDLRNDSKKCSISIHTQKNAGVSSARNYGIEHSDTEYIAFADQDDYLMPNAIKKCMKAAEQQPYDIIIGGFCRQNSKGRTTRKWKPTEDEWSKYCLTYPWGRVFRRDFLIQNNIRFKKVSIGEDVYFDLVAYSYTEKIKMISDILYCWYENPKSVSNTKYISIHADVDPIATFDMILEDTNKLDSQLKPLYEYYFIKFSVWYLLTNFRKSRYQYWEFQRQAFKGWLKNKFPEYKENNYLKKYCLPGDTVQNTVAVRFFSLMML